MLKYMKKKNLEKIISELEREGFLAWIKNVYKKQGSEIYLVGGAVRDALLGDKEIKDFDFVVRGWSLEELEKELGKLGRVDLVGKTFGVFKFMPQGKKIEVPFDIALPRKEISLASGGYRDFKVEYDGGLEIKEDLGRRDFTVNALAYEIKSGKLVDEFKGVKDLEDKIIRTVGNGYERFREDYSRMLRGIRFACQLDWQIEEVTWQALCKLITHINNEREGERVVPYEVIASELLKSFVDSPLRAFDLYDKSGATKELMSELLGMKGCPQPPNWHSEGDVWEHTRLCLKNLEAEPFRERFKDPIIFIDKKSKLINVELVMAVLWHDVGKPYTIQTPERDGSDRIRFNEHDNIGAKTARKVFEKLKLSAAPEFDFEPERASWLIAKHHLFDPKTIKEMKNSTVEKYFFWDKFSGEDLLKIGFIDKISSIWADRGEGEMESFEMMVERINELKKLGKGKKLPDCLLNGDEVMKILKLKPGKKVGEILDKLREEQLGGEIKAKKEARDFIRKNF